MSGLKSYIVDEVVQKCFNLYNKLPKTGKPVDKEWTVLSCIIQYDHVTKDIDVVSLGTGSKCIGASKMCSLGKVLNDSHAEIIARRGFLLYLYDNIDKFMNNEKSIFVSNHDKFKLKENIDFMFYSSQLPCGDASIIPKSTQEENLGDVLKPYKRAACSDGSDINNKIVKIDDIHRTGAKCLQNSQQDPKGLGVNYHILGQVRTKPGRGDRTLSVSCSDKMARWIHLGIQGSLLDMLIEPIFIKYLIFGGRVPYSNESLMRSFFTRCPEYSETPKVAPYFFQTTLVFPFIKTDEFMRPASGSILWVNQHHEVSVQGRKLGVTKKNSGSLNSILSISKYNLLRTFLRILDKNDKFNRAVNCSNVYNIPYNAMKNNSKRYKEIWLKVKKDFFKTWTVKPDIWDFCVDATELNEVLMC